MESCEFDHQCYVCGVKFSTSARHSSDELSSCNMRFEDKLCQVLSYHKPSERGTDVCESCWSLIENIARQQNELCVMIEEVNDRLARSLQQNFELRKDNDRQENEPEVCLHFCFPLECSELFVMTNAVFYALQVSVDLAMMEIVRICQYFNSAFCCRFPKFVFHLHIKRISLCS